MTPATRAIAALVACLTLTPSAALARDRPPEAPARPLFVAGSPVAGAATGARTEAPEPDSDLVVAITSLGSSATLLRGRPLVVRGTVTNVASTRRLDVRAYEQLSPDPATTLEGLDTFANVSDDTGIGNPDLTPGEYADLRTILPQETRRFVIRVPYRHLLISGAPGVYRLGIKVLSTTPAGLRDPNRAGRAHTLLPLLPTGKRQPAPVQALTLLPLSAPVKRLTGGRFADDSLVALLEVGGRLANELAWARGAAPDTVQVVIDPALLAAVKDMSNGYRVASRTPPYTSISGRGEAVASRWLATFQRVASRQHVMLLPWGGPAADSLIASGLPGPVLAAVRASAAYATASGLGNGVVGWLADGRSGLPAIDVMHRGGAIAQIVSQASLPGLAPDNPPVRPSPSSAKIAVGGQRIPALVVGTTLGGVTTTADTSALDFRQRLIAEATVRSVSGQTARVAVTALPFEWNPGPPRRGQALAGAFATPLLIGQSVIGAIDRPSIRYDGAVRPAPGPTRGLPVPVVGAIRSLRTSGGTLASILSSSAVARLSFQRAYAMSGSAQWIDFPRAGASLVDGLATADRDALARVTVTGPPFVAMSSDSGRFPLTVTNGLGKTISVRLAVTPENPALSISAVPTITLPAGSRRDIQVVSTATGSGVTSVRARLATPTGQQFGRTWKFDVRATQLGLLIWLVIGAGGMVLFSAAGYRIVRRLRGLDVSRRQTPV